MEEHDHVIYGWLFGELAEHGYGLAREAVGLPSYRHPNEVTLGRVLEAAA